MTVLDDLERQPERFDFFVALRHIERSDRARPRLGEAGTRRDEAITLGQDTYLAFPDSNLARVRKDPAGRREILVRFLGLLGPQGALPNAVTEEVIGYLLARDEAFPRFLDIFHHRFLQLFFRAWADARPIAQNDRPADDRFIGYLGAAFGLESPIFRKLDSIPDEAKLAFAGLFSGGVRSASRLRSLVAGLFGVDAEIEEFVGLRLELEPSDRSKIGEVNSGLGTSLMLGQSCYTAQDKFRIKLFAPDLTRYRQFLPSGDLSEPLADLVYFYIGEQYDWDVELALPAGKVEPVRIGQSGQLGWTTWMAPNWSDSETTLRRDARFSPAERVARKRGRTS